MASEAFSVERQYVDRSVQTSPIIATGRRTDGPDPHESATADVCTVVTKFQNLVMSENASMLREDPGVLQRPPSFSSTHRSLTRNILSHRKPTEFENSKMASSRVVSLPETIPGYSERKILRQPAKMRVASMPAKFGGQALTVDSSFSDQSQGSILPDSEAPARIRVYSGATDIPHTPSPPSSPESVEIIGSNPQISERFLQGDSCTDISSPSIDEEDDGNLPCFSCFGGLILMLPTEWASWARSPPRPIPALHGPLSLPYARCPS